MATKVKRDGVSSGDNVVTKVVRSKRELNARKTQTQDIAGGVNWQP